MALSVEFLGVVYLRVLSSQVFLIFCTCFIHLIFPPLSSIYMRCSGCSTLRGVNVNQKKVTWTVLVYDTPNFVKAINKITWPQVSCYILWTIFIQYHVNIWIGGIDFWNITLSNIWHNLECICVMISVITFFCSETTVIFIIIFTTIISFTIRLLAKIVLMLLHMMCNKWFLFLHEGKKGFLFLISVSWKLKYLVKCSHQNIFK